MANKLDAQIALEEALWQGMNTWVENREEKLDVYDKDDLQWGTGITDMFTTVLTTKEGGQRGREGWKSDPNGAGPGASIHPEAMQAGGAEKAEER